MSEYRKQFHAILKRAHDIQLYRNKINSLVQQKDDGSGSKFRTLEQFSENCTKMVATEKNQLAEMLKKVEAIIASRRNVSIREDTVPDVDTIRCATQAFTETPLLKPVPAPYPSLCGAMPLASDHLLQPGSFVCVQNQNSEYILAIILGFNPETFEYRVCDADPEADDVVLIIVEASKVMPLPTTVPARRSKATTYQIGARVLALWPEENNSWTSVFYNATVMQQPTNSPGSYTLQFDGDPPLLADVPEKFIVAAPNE